MKNYIHLGMIWVHLKKLVSLSNLTWLFGYGERWRDDVDDGDEEIEEEEDVGEEIEEEKKEFSYYDFDFST